MKSLNKVAEISLLFWLMKIVATTLGETLGGFIAALPLLLIVLPSLMHVVFKNKTS